MNSTALFVPVMTSDAGKIRVNINIELTDKLRLGYFQRRHKDKLVEVLENGNNYGAAVKHCKKLADPCPLLVMKIAILMAQTRDFWALDAAAQIAQYYVNHGNGGSWTIAQEIVGAIETNALPGNMSDGVRKICDEINGKLTRH